MTLRLLLILSLSFAVQPGRVRADTDYRCLNQCVNAGGPSSSCLTQCSYAAPRSAPAKSSQGNAQDGNSVSGHNQFAAPLPSDGTLLLSPASKPAVPPKENYQCLAACEHDNEEVQLCRHRCALNQSQGVAVGATTTNPGTLQTAIGAVQPPVSK